MVAAITNLSSTAVMAEGDIYFGVGFVESSFSETDDGVKPEYAENILQVINR